MADIALGVKVFSRAEKLENLLESVEDTEIAAVYIADDGEQMPEKTQIYEAEYPFELTVLDLEYDAGLGYGRNRIVDESNEEFLLIVDSDHEVPRDVGRLRKQLEASPRLGGVGGLLFERGKIRGVCHDLYERDNILVRDVRADKTVERVADEPLVRFEFIPNAAMFRRECLEASAWDPEYVIGKEHLDFYVAHYRGTDWEFGVNPTVLFDHYPGGSSSYVADRESATKLQQSKQYFLDKWGYRQLFLGQTDWFDATRRRRTPQQIGGEILKSIALSAPPSLLGPLMDLRGIVRKLRNRPPL